jgi:hypothetical protein
VAARVIRAHLAAVSMRNSALTAALTIMENILRKPVVIAAIVATIGVATIILVNLTYLIVDPRPPQSPIGTTFNAVNEAGAEISPTPAESKIKLPSMGPTPVTPPSARPQ